jgi:hypothetical protein
VAVTCQLTERGFSTRDKVNDDRLGIKLSLQMKLVNMLKFDEDTYLHILHYGLMANIYLLGLMFYL